MLAPHPDDEVLGCGGTLALMNKKEAKSTVVFLTSGEKLQQSSSRAIAAERKKEARQASRLLGCLEPLFLDFPDSEITKYSAEIADTLSGLIEKNRPDILFSPSPIDYHEDHLATSRIAFNVCSSFRSTTLVFYEIYSTTRFNHLTDITQVVEEKKRVIRNYRSSLYGKPEIYAEAVIGLNAHRSLFVQSEGYYEAFYIVQKDDDMGSILDYFSYKDGSI
jgi:LmbE family N-acetylglucosaminyl deacetylase